MKANVDTSSSCEWEPVVRLPYVSGHVGENIRLVHCLIDTQFQNIYHGVLFAA